MRESWRLRRLDVAVNWTRAELRLGHAESAAGALPDLITEYPLAEPLECLLMEALHAAGRDAEAIDRYAVVRERLAEALGADPGPEVRAVYEAILRGAPLTTAPLASARPGQAGQGGGAVVIVAIDGMAGVGKTTLAVHWAHQVAGLFPDGQLYVNLHGFDPNRSPATLDEAVRGFLDALDVPPERVPATPEAQVGLPQPARGRRVLVLLDNASDAGQVRPLLPGAPGCVVLVTSRTQLAGLVTTAGAYPMTLDLPSAVEGSGRIWLERFSPLYTQPERFGVRRREPARGYQYVYPGRVDLDRVAYFFDYEVAGALPESTYDPLRTALAAWGEAWQSGPRPR